ncbi:unnamed protein product, partial [Rangifer tarandus platyrhynchus]
LKQKRQSNIHSMVCLHILVTTCEANSHEKQWIQKLEQMQGCVLNREYFLPPGQ